MQKLSIIIPVFNVENYIDKCIKSVQESVNYYLTANSISADSIMEKLEVILIDDGSTDSSKVIAEQYSKACDYITVIHKENEGVAKARNVGLRMAKGSYIWFVDSDDEIAKDSVDVIIRNVIKFDDTDIFLYDAIKISEEKASDWSHFSLEWASESLEFNMMLSAGALYFSILNQDKKCNIENTKIPLAAPWDKVVRRKFLLENEIEFNEELRVLDDMVFSMKIFSCSKITRYTKEKIYKYRYVDNSITHCYTPDRVAKDTIVWEKLWEEYDRIFELNNILYNSRIQEIYEQAIYLRIIKSFSISCSLSLFNKKNPYGFRTKLKSAKMTVKLPYYNSAFKNVHLKNAEWKLKPVIIMARLRFMTGIFLLSKLNELV